MDPRPLTSPDWTNILVLVRALWVLLALVVVFGGAFLSAHVFLPYLAATSNQPRGVKHLRLALYSVSAIALVTAVVLATRTLSQVSSVLQFYPKLWM